MSIEQNKQVARTLYDEVLNGGKLELLDELATSDYEEHDPLPGQGTGLEGLKDRFRILTTAIDQTFFLEDVIAEGDRVVVRWKNKATHVGEFVGIPATGKDYSINGIDIYRVEDGKLAEHWHVVDQLSMLQQVGIIPGPEGR
ncbi:MAG: ester cyclase [Actinomycetota bacterium]|nr:ester cyclase [Actinomycetota bacterium]